MNRKSSIPAVLFLSLVLGGMFFAAVRVEALSGAKVIRVLDECEMNSFNAALGFPVCSKDGKVTFEEFVAFLTKSQRHPAWRFNPLSAAVVAGKIVVLENSGGEFHTFTRVAEFGGGFVPDLNFGQDPRPECFAPESATNIGLEAGATETGPTAGTAELPNGETKWMCCVHPWMRATLRVP